jgi:hypothetical protein
MMARKRHFYSGLGLLAGFAVVLAIFFSPVFNGHNGLQYLDNLYNSISKGSAYYIPKVKEEADRFMGVQVEFTCTMNSAEQAKQTALLFKKSGANVTIADAALKVDGDLGKFLQGCLADADSMYVNDGQTVAAKYGYNERQVLYNWWQALKAAAKGLQKQKKFKEADVLDLAIKKALETSYNFYGIEPQKITERMGVVTISLLFYVVYTLWYGFAIMYMFEGLGLKLEH